MKISKQKEYTDLIMQISFNMLNTNSEDAFFKSTLAKIGETIDVSRVYLFHYEHEIWNNTHEWVATGVERNIDNLQNIKIGDDNYDHVLKVILKGDIYIITNINDIPNKRTRDMLRKQGISSILAVPLYFQGAVRGLFGFDICGRCRKWPEEYINLIVTIANILSSAKQHFYMSSSLANKQDQMQYIIDAIPEPIYVTDMQDYKILFWNKYIRDSFPAELLRSEKCYKVFQNKDQPCSFCTNSKLNVVGEPLAWYHHNDIIGQDYKVIDQLILWDNNEPARLSVAFNITESLRLQREEVLAKEASLAKSNFLANMSHEIRTPLNGIIGLNYLAMQETHSQKVKNYLEKIDISSKTLLSLINEILDFSKVEAGKMEIESIPFNFKEIINNVYDMIMPNLLKKDVKFDLHIDPNIPDILRGDSLRFSQILFNIVSNADKFTSHGQISLDAKLLESVQNKEYIQIIVQDSGIGMTDEQMDKLFVEFTQADSSTTRKYGGTGLGLAICKRLIEFMGGTIKLSSKIDIGTRFELNFVFDLVDNVQNAKMRNLEEGNIAAILADKKILLVEDNEINQLIATEILESQKCIVDLACDGIEAVEKVRKNPYDLVLMDIQMPNMDGLEATVLIRQDERFNDLPIIAMTAHAMLTDYEKSLAVGMNGHITKPIEPHIMCKKIASCLS